MIHTKFPKPPATSSPRWLPRLLPLAALLLCGWLQGIDAQDYDRYKPLQCMGPIPEELRVASSAKYQRELAQLGDSAMGREGKARDEFLLQSNFVLDEMLLSGKVIFGDPVTEYITQVKDRILANDPALAQKIRIYLVKSPVVNAFATNSGVVLVNMGLIAHLRTEAELAFVLCHEIQHYIHKHTINSYVHSENLKSNAKLLGLNSAEDYIAARSRYSRELELDADALGFKLFLASGYSLDAAASVYDLLGMADEPFDQMPWESGFFEWEMLRYPNRFSLWPLDSLKPEEEEDDEMSTHPNIAKRRAATAAAVEAAGAVEGEAFLVGAPQFLDVRKRCRFELSDLYLDNHSYEAAIYNSFLLLTEEPESHYLRKTIAQAIYGLASYKNARNFGYVHHDPDDREGEFQQLCHFFDQMDRESLSLTATHVAWTTYLADPDDIELKALAEDLLRQLFEKHKSTTEWLEWERPQVVPQMIDSIMQARAAAVQARQRPAPTDGEEEIKEKDDDEDYSNDFMKWSLTDLFQVEDFVVAWDSAKAFRKRVNEGDEPESGLREMTTQDKVRGWSLGIDSLVAVQPIYKRVDTRASIPVQYIAAEEELAVYKAYLGEMYDRNDIHYQFLENRGLDADETQTFNDVSVMLQWFSEHLNGSSERLKLVNFKQDEAQALIDRYGTRYFAWNGIVQVTTKPSSLQKFGWILVGCYFPPLIPLAIIKATKPVTATLFVTMIYDLESSEVVLERYHPLKAKASKHIMRSVLYDNAMQIKGGNGK